MRMSREKIFEESEFRPLNKEDLSQLASLILGMKGYSSEDFWLKSINAQYYEWMYFDNPLGGAHTCAAFHEGNLVASFAISPRKFFLNGKKTLIGKTMDMFTNPRYQGLGLMSVLTESCYRDARAGGMEKYYVTPSDKSYPIFLKKFGYKEPFKVNYRVKPINPAPLLEKTLKGIRGGGAVSGVVDKAAKRVFSIVHRGAFNGYEFEEVNCFDINFNMLWEASAEPFTGLCRDTDYLTWRYVKHPDEYRVFKMYRGGRFEGYLVTKITQRRGYRTGEVVDFFVDWNDRRALHALLLYASGYLRGEGCLAAQVWSIENGRYEQQFARAGFRFRRKKLHFLLSPDCTDRNFYDRMSWHLTQGDGNDL